MDRDVYILGDHHGNWSAVFDIVNRAQITDALVICVGDCGIGFCSHDLQRKQFGLLNDGFEEIGVEFWSIRGNHDDPYYFDGSVDLPNFKLLPDYSVRTINGEKFLFVGGATSIDRHFRKEGRDYWSGEVFNFDKDKIEECDVLITHSAPSWIGPSHTDAFVKQYYHDDPALEKELQTEREEIGELFDLAKPSYFYCGHFHRAEKRYYDNCWARILSINEIDKHERD